MRVVELIHIIACCLLILHNVQFTNNSTPSNRSHIGCNLGSPVVFDYNAHLGLVCGCRLCCRFKAELLLLLVLSVLQDPMEWCSTFIPRKLLYYFYIRRFVILYSPILNGLTLILPHFWVCELPNVGYPVRLDPLALLLRGVIVRFPIFSGMCEKRVGDQALRE